MGRTRINHDSINVQVVSQDKDPHPHRTVKFSSETHEGMVSCRRDDELAPGVFVVTFVSPGGLSDALDVFKLFCDDMFLRSRRHVSSFCSQL